MKRLVIALMLLASAGLAEECINDIIVFQQGPEDVLCGLEVTPFVVYELQLVAKFYRHEDPISRVEFKVDNPLLDPYYSTGVVEWDWGYQIAGDFATGIVLEFDPPFDPSVDEVVLATVSFMSFVPSWPQEDHVMNVEEPAVYDIYGQQFYTTRGFYTFNPTEPWTYCMLTGDYETMDEHSEAINPPQGATVNDYFDLTFTAVAWLCMPELPVTFVCEVFMDGNAVFVMEGEGSQPYIVPLDVSGYDPGDEITVEIFVHSSGSSHATIHYTVDDPVAAQGTSFSTLRSLY